MVDPTTLEITWSKGGSVRLILADDPGSPGSPYFIDSQELGWLTELLACCGGSPPPPGGAEGVTALTKPAQAVTTDATPASLTWALPAQPTLGVWIITLGVVARVNALFDPELNPTESVYVRLLAQDGVETRQTVISRYEVASRSQTASGLAALSQPVGEITPVTEIRELEITVHSLTPASVAGGFTVSMFSATNTGSTGNPLEYRLTIERSRLTWVPVSTAYPEILHS